MEGRDLSFDWPRQAQLHHERDVLDYEDLAAHLDEYGALRLPGHARSASCGLLLVLHQELGLLEDLNATLNFPPMESFLIFGAHPKFPPLGHHHRLSHSRSAVD